MGRYVKLDGTSGTNTKTKAERDAIALAIYAHLYRGYVDKSGKLHKLHPDGAAANRFAQLQNRAKLKRTLKF